MRKKTFLSVALSALLGLGMFSTFTYAQEPVAEEAVASQDLDIQGIAGFGTRIDHRKVFAATDFTATDNANGQPVQYRVSPTTFRVTNNTTANFYKGISDSLPAGSLIERVFVYGCDNSNAARLEVELVRYEGAAHVIATQVGTTNTGNAAVPGCGRFEIDLTGMAGGGETLRHADPTDATKARWYGVRVRMLGNVNDYDQITFRGVEVVYRPQVDMAPISASFLDVPSGHPFFQHIEALKATQVTSGCGAGKFCPDAFLTRGEAAVWLALTTGLWSKN